MNRTKNRSQSPGGIVPERIKIKDIAGDCMVSQTTVRRWIENGQLRASRLPSGHYRINRIDYDRFLEEYGFVHIKATASPNLKEERGSR